jgi:hypothetical protein
MPVPTTGVVFGFTEPPFADMLGDLRLKSTAGCWSDATSQRMRGVPAALLL